jgi:hypothetical protein
MRSLFSSNEGWVGPRFGLNLAVQVKTSDFTLN